MSDTRVVTVRSDRDVDALVATTCRVPQSILSDAPRFTSDPVACAALKRKLREDGCSFGVAWFGGNWEVWVRHCAGDVPDRATADTEERALALAALLAHGIEVQYEPEPAA